MAWTVDELVAAMKRKTNLPPNANAKFDDPALRTIAYEALITRVDPVLTNLREEYGVAREDFAITAGLATYVLPRRAVSGTIRQVLYVSATGESVPLERISEAESWRYEGSTATAGVPAGYTIEDATIRLLPTPSDASYSLRIKYRRRPASLVAVAACALVTGGNGTTTLVTTGGSWSASQDVDVVRARPPFGTLLVQTPTNFAGGTFTFAGGVLPGKGIVAGDYVCQPDTTCVVPVPERFHTLLLDYASAQLSAEWGDTAYATTLWAATDAYVARLELAQSNRAEAQPQIVFQRDGALRGGFGFGRGRR